MIKLAALGATGRVGSRVLRLLADDDRFRLVAALTRSDDPRLGETVQVRGHRATITDSTDRPFDVLIDFALPAATMHLLEHCQRTGAAIVPGFSVRTGPGLSFRNWFEAPLEVLDTGDREADVLRITSALNLRVEAAVRQAPEQWLWVHRRWKTVPPPQPDSP